MNLTLITSNRLVSLTLLLLGISCLFITSCESVETYESKAKEKVQWLDLNGNLVVDSSLINLLEHHKKVNNKKYVPRLFPMDGVFFHVANKDTLYQIEYRVKNDTIYFANSHLSIGAVQKSKIKDNWNLDISVRKEGEEVLLYD